MKDITNIDPLSCEFSYIYDGKLLHSSVFNPEWLDDPLVILDVGAYDFGDSIKFKNQFPDCEIYAFEMVKDNYDKHSPYALSRGIFTYNNAVSDSDGVSQYYRGKHTGGVNAQSSLLKPTSMYSNCYSHIVSHDEQPTETIAITLSSFCKEKNLKDIDLLHIDVEGAEYKVIAGLGEVRPKMIFAEFLLDGGWSNQKSFEDTIRLLDSMGYDKIKDLPHDKLFVYRG